MLQEMGVRFVIVGHSERRTDCGESDAIVRAKAEAAWRAGLLPIVCIGETLDERDRNETMAVLDRQIKEGLDRITGEQLSGMVIAYEPVWAIGTGLTPTTPEIEEVHEAIRATLVEMFGEAARAVPILYGGSVKPANARELMSVENVDGALVGGASLTAHEFMAIAKAYA